jgi:ATP-dependent Clp protease adaptor protein ClpS
MNNHNTCFHSSIRCSSDDAGNTGHQESPASQDDTVLAVQERPEPRPTLQKPPVDRMPLWKVLLHNDDHNDVLHVVESIVMLTPLGIDDAVDKTKEADETGVALLMTTHKEKAELIQEQFTSRKLTVTIEPDAR